VKCSFFVATIFCATFFIPCFLHAAEQADYVTKLNYYSQEEERAHRCCRIGTALCVAGGAVTGAVLHAASNDFWTGVAFCAFAFGYPGGVMLMVASDIYCMHIHKKLYGS
jgi:hypothetical protein